MKVTILRSYFDPGVRVFHPGQVVDLDDKHAGALIRHGIASPADSTPVIETASAPRKRKRETR
jgi:hypothetical protein